MPAIKLRRYSGCLLRTLALCLASHAYSTLVVPALSRSLKTFPHGDSLPTRNVFCLLQFFILFLLDTCTFLLYLQFTPFIVCVTAWLDSSSTMSIFLFRISLSMKTICCFNECLNFLHGKFPDGLSSEETDQ